MTLTIRTDRDLIRARAASTRYVLVSFTAPQAPPRSERLPINIALVLDRSGSMAGERKFDLARSAVEQALAMLHPEDRFTLVVYDTEVDVLMPSSKATPDARRRALDALRTIHPRGSTDLCGGWMRGCEQLARHLAEEGITRALLLTDGLANHGVTDHPTLVRHAEELRQRGIATSTFGVGADFDERLLRDMALHGGGNFYFVSAPEQIPDLLTSELGEALEVVAPRAAIEILLPRGADAQPLSRLRYTRARGDNELRVELGDLASGQEVRAVIQVTFPLGAIGEETSIRMELSADGAPFAMEARVVRWKYASHEDNDAQPRDREVDREVATMYAAMARAEATEANRRGDFGRARRVLERTSARIREYAGNDPVMNQLAQELRAQVPEFAEQVMAPMALKAAMYRSENEWKGRDTMGRARRGR